MDAVDIFMKNVEEFEKVILKAELLEKFIEEHKAEKEFKKIINSRFEYKNTALHIAAKKGRTDIIEMLIKAGAKLALKNECGTFPFVNACEYGHLEAAKLLFDNMNEEDKEGCVGTALYCVIFQMRYSGTDFEPVIKYLIENGAKINRKYDGGDSLLHIAAYYNLLEIAKILLDKGVDINIRNDKLETPLHKAMRVECADMVSLLIEHGADVNAQKEYERTPLHDAAGNGLVKIARILVENGADMYAKDKLLCTPIYYASMVGSKGILEIFLEKGMDIDIWVSGDTPLLITTHKGCGKTSRFLIEHGANVNVRDKDNKTPLYWAAFNNSTDIMELLLEKGVDVDVRANFTGKTPLLMVPEFTGSGEHALRLLLEHGADVNARDKENKTVLYDCSHEDTFRLLLKYGADVNIRTVKNRTSLHHHAIWGNTDMVKLLIENGAEIDVKDIRGHTPLLDAIEYNHMDTAAFLIEHGADVNIQDNRGDTALHLVSRFSQIPNTEKKKRRELVELLIKHGADINIKNKEGRRPIDHCCFTTKNVLKLLQPE